MQAEAVPSRAAHKQEHHFRPRTLEAHCSNVLQQMAQLQAHGIEAA